MTALFRLLAKDQDVMGRSCAVGVEGINEGKRYVWKL